MPAKQKSDKSDDKGTTVAVAPVYDIGPDAVTINGIPYMRGMPAQVGVLKAMHLLLCGLGFDDKDHAEDIQAILSALVQDADFVSDKIAAVSSSAAGLLMSAKTKSANDALGKYNADHAEDIASIDAVLAQIDALKEDAASQTTALKEDAAKTLGNALDPVFDIAYAPGTGLVADLPKKTTGTTRTRKSYDYLAKSEYSFGPTGFGTGDGCDWKHIITLTPNDGATKSGGGDNDQAWGATSKIISGTNAPIDSTYTTAKKTANDAVVSAVESMREANADHVGDVAKISISVPKHFGIPVAEDAEEDTSD